MSITPKIFTNYEALPTVKEKQTTTLYPNSRMDVTSLRILCKVPYTGRFRMSITKVGSVGLKVHSVCCALENTCVSKTNAVVHVEMSFDITPILKVG